MSNSLIPINKPKFVISYCSYILRQADEDKDQDEEGVLGRPSIWVGTHTIYYRACIGDVGESSTSASSKNSTTNYSTPSKSTKKSQGKRNKDSSGGKSSVLNRLYVLQTVKNVEKVKGYGNIVII